MERIHRRRSPRSTLHLLLVLHLMLYFVAFDAKSDGSSNPTPKPWPEQFHALLYMNLTSTGSLQITNLWYDWPRRRNLNLIQRQLGDLLYDVEWDNGTSYYYTLGPGGSCLTRYFPVGVLRPDWPVHGSHYLGRRLTGGFECNVWEKVDFIWYYEDVVSRRPVRWDFYDGITTYVMTFEEGAVLEDSEWQAPSYCFGDGNGDGDGDGGGIGSLVDVEHALKDISREVDAVNLHQLYLRSFI